MKIGIILETKEFEKAWNAFVFAVTAKKTRTRSKNIFNGEAVECEGLTHEKYNVDVTTQSIFEYWWGNSCLRNLFKIKTIRKYRSLSDFFYD